MTRAARPRRQAALRGLICVVIVVMDPRSIRVQTAPSPPANGSLTGLPLPGVSSGREAVLEFRILGPVEVIDRDKALALGGQKQRAVLAALLIDAGQVVSTDYLVDALWGEHAAEDRGHLPAELRLAAAEGCSGPTSSSRSRPATSSGSSRASSISTASRSSSRRRAPPAPRSARPRCARRSRCGAATPFADFTFESFAQPEIARLNELRLSVLEERIDADLEAGRHAELVGELEPLVAEYPLRERLRAQLMLALYRSGRQAEALQAYQDARSALVDELGIEPSPALSQLHGCDPAAGGRARPPGRRPARGGPLPRGRARAAGGPGRPGPRRRRRRARGAARRALRLPGERRRRSRASRSTSP